MRILVLNILRGVRRRIFQYLGIALLLIIIIATMTGLYGSSDRVQFAFSQVEQNSGVYDYRIDFEELNDYKNVDQSLVRIKDIIKKQFPNTLPDYDTIINQIDEITTSNIQNNSLPAVSGTLDENLKTYLLNWGVSYKSILINDILNTDVKIDPLTSNYQLKKSFLKSFTYNNKDRKWFFTFEDAYYLNELTFPTDRFNFSPYRNGFNEIYLVQGRNVSAIDEVIINPTFAKKNHIAIDDHFSFLPNQTFKVVGFGYTYWGTIPPLTADNIEANPNNTTPVFTTREWLNQYLYDNSNYLSNLLTPFFLKVENNDAFFQNRLESILNKTFNFNYGSLVIANSDDLRSGAMKQNFNMQNIIYSAISFIVMLAAVFIVLSYVKKEIDLQKKQIGLIKALGYNNLEISFGFTLLFFLLSIISTSLGFLLGLPLQMRFNDLSDFGFFLPLTPIFFSWISLVIAVIVTTIIFTLTSYWQSYSSLNKNPLLLINDRSSNTSSKLLVIFKKPFNYWKFKPRLAVSFALKSVGKLVLIFFIFVFATFLLLFENVAIDIFDKKIENFYSYVNKDVFYYNSTVNMYKFDDNGKIQTQIYDWVIEKNLDTTKELTSDTFHIDSQAKKDRLDQLKAETNYKEYYITSAEVTLLYRNTHAPNNCLDYITANDAGFINQLEATVICQALNKFFDMIISQTGMNPQVENLPGFAIGQNILNNNYYPNLEFSASSPAAWIGHDQGPLISKKSFLISLYNNSDPNNPLVWKNWFNIREENGRDIDPVFNSSHNLVQEQVTYIDGFGARQTKDAYIVPAVISKALATLNKYQVGNRVLMIINSNGRFIPVIFNIRGVTTTNLDTPAYYFNIDDLRKVIGYVDGSNQPLIDSFNTLYSKDRSSFFPLNSINIAQPDNDYSMNGLQNNFLVINTIPLVMPLIKERLGQIFSSIKTIIEISKWLTVIALAFVLIIIVNMILDNNLMIIAMMKAMGYRINEINLLIIGSYIFTLLMAFILGTVFSYVIWGIILWIVAKLSSTIFILPILPLTIFLSFLLIFVIIVIGYAVGLYFIKFKPVASLLQSE